MPRIERTAEIAWEGNLARGGGRISAGSSGAFAGLAYSHATRIGQPEGKTSPEELLAAAHGGCFTMSLAGELTGLGHPPERLEVDLPDRHGRGRGAGPPDRRLAGDGHRTVAGDRRGDVRRGVKLADEGCPFSALLKRAGGDGGDPRRARLITRARPAPSAAGGVRVKRPRGAWPAARFDRISSSRRG